MKNAEDFDELAKRQGGGFAKDMTVRDEFAGRAMQILKKDIWNFDLLCKNAYELADAMLKARDGK